MILWVTIWLHYNVSQFLSLLTFVGTYIRGKGLPMKSLNIEPPRTMMIPQYLIYIAHLSSPFFKSFLL